MKTLTTAIAITLLFMSAILSAPDRPRVQLPSERGHRFDVAITPAAFAKASTKI